MNQKNKSAKTQTQFYLQPINSKTLRKVQSQNFSYQTRKLRFGKVFEFNCRIQERAEKSLINFNSLSKIFQAEQKVFRSSSSFKDPQKACLNNQKIRLSSLLRSHILQKDDEKNKKQKFFLKNKNQERYKDLSVSNYDKFAGILATHEIGTHEQELNKAMIRNRFRR